MLNKSGKCRRFIIVTFQGEFYFERRLHSECRLTRCIRSRRCRIGALIPPQSERNDGDKDDYYHDDDFHRDLLALAIFHPIV
jgi:hypothetical protein